MNVWEIFKVSFENEEILLIYFYKHTFFIWGMEEEKVCKTATAELCMVFVRVCTHLSMRSDGSSMGSSVLYTIELAA